MFRRTCTTSDKETLETVASGKVKAAMVWGPTLQAYLKSTPDAKLSAYPLDEPHARYQVVALYGEDGTADAARFQKAVADLGGSSALDKTIASDGEGGGTTTVQPPAPSSAPRAARRRRRVARALYGGAGQARRTKVLRQLRAVPWRASRRPRRAGA